MPRFREDERREIQKSLRSEGERLFVRYGLKKVTIDELAAAAHIAKASFYRFYDSKEELFLDIAATIQSQIFASLENLLKNQTGMSGRERVIQVFGALYELMRQFPILAGIDPATVELLARKVSQERLSCFYRQNLDAVLLMQQYGIRFRYDAATVSLAFQALYQAWLSLPDTEPEQKQQVAGILLEGTVNGLLQYP